MLDQLVAERDAMRARLLQLEQQLLSAGLPLPPPPNQQQQQPPDPAAASARWPPQDATGAKQPRTFHKEARFFGAFYLACSTLFSCSRSYGAAAICLLLAMTSLAFLL